MAWAGPAADPSALANDDIVARSAVQMQHIAGQQNPYERAKTASEMGQDITILLSEEMSAHKRHYDPAHRALGTLQADVFSAGVQF